MGHVDAVVVGSGPNGLAAALVLAAAGLSVQVFEAADSPGGGARTKELTLPGFQHDVCSAVHPMAAASPFFRAFDLPAHGVELLQPEVAYAQPLDGGRAGLAWRDLERTCEGLGADGAAWRSLFAPLAERWRPLVDTAFSDLRTFPRDLPAAVRFGLRTLEQGTPLWRARFREDVAPALLAGSCAHSILPLHRLGSTSVGMMLGVLAHAVGWPIPRGGSGAITAAMTAALQARGGTVITGHRITSLAELPRTRAVLLDVAAPALLTLAGDRLPRGYAALLRRYRPGGGVCKVDFALSEPVPWAAPGCALAGTLHLAGNEWETAVAERQVAQGRHPRRPYVLVSQPGVVDPGRAPAGRHVLWTYAHVPHGSTRDMSEEITEQIERFAPGFREIVLAKHVITAAELPAYNANYAGGDISAGATTVRQLAARPVPRWDPYRTPLPGVYLCSASTAPGPGVHGMAGVHAAARVLRRRFGIRTNPYDLVRTLRPPAAGG
jgi:phytoene dehydrogenase-like protein